MSLYSNGLSNNGLRQGKGASDPHKKGDLFNDSKQRSSSPKVKRTERLTLYVPGKINIEEILKQHPPDFKHHRDCFVYILHLITSVASGRMDMVDHLGFTPINKQLLQKRIHGYRKYIDYLLDVGLVEESRHYLVGERSRGLRFTSEYKSEVVPVIITKWTLIKSILSKREQEDHSKININYLIKWFDNKLEVDFDEAMKYLKDEYHKDCADANVKHEIERLNSRLITLQKINRKEYFGSVDLTAGRLHTPLTQLLSELRRFVKYDGETLCNIDITNSQPLLSIAFLKEEIYQRNKMEERYKRYKGRASKILIERGKQVNKTDKTPIMLVKKLKPYFGKPDVKRYIDLVTNGVFYEEFGKMLKQQNDGVEDAVDFRKRAKNATFNALFSNNSAIAYKKEMQDFKRSFPNVYQIFYQIKKGRGNHSILACSLQNLEAELIIHEACKQISKERPDIPMFTIHDSIVTPLRHKDFVKERLEKVLEIALDCKPKLKVEAWK